MARKSRINTPKNIYKVGFYIRISVEDEISNSIENQEILLKNYIKNQDDLKLIDIYIDNGATGTNFERTRFKDLIYDIDKEKINCIIVKDLSRFGRNYIETGKYLEEILPKKNVRFIAINDNYDSITPDSLHILNLHIKNIINHMYAKDISKKICTSIRTKQLNGDFIGSVATFGYKKNKENKYKLEIDKNACNTVKYIFNLRLKGKSYLSIAKELNNKKIPCPNKYKFENGILFNEKYKNCIWSESTIKKILKNQVYLGHTIQGTKRKEFYKEKNIKSVSKDDLIIVHNTHTPIIDEKTFFEVQKMNKDNCKKYINSIENMNKKADNIYRNILECGECGASLYLINKKEPYYKCSKNKVDSNICNFDKFYKKDIDDIVFISLKTQIDIFLDKNKFLNKNNGIKEYTEKLNKINEELSKFTLFYERLYKDFLDNILQENEYVEFKQNYKEKEKSLLKQKEELENEYNKLKNNKFDKVYKLLKFEDKSILTEKLINTFIKSIKISNNNHFEIMFNFKGEL